MSAPDQTKVENRLLSLMEKDDFALLADHLELVETLRGRIIVEPYEPISCIYFPESGLGSIVAVLPGRREVEAGIFARDGCSPLAIVLGSDRTTTRILFQADGHSWRIARRAFEEALAKSISLRLLLTRYAHVLSVQTMYTALSNAIHAVDQRLARWLLMCHDRIDGDKIGITHEFIALMLAVRRPSVTTALHTLEGHGFIRSERACITIRNRAALVEFAGEAYGKSEAEYERLIGQLRPEVRSA